MNLILQAIKSLFRKLENAIPKKLSDLENDLKLSDLENDIKLSAPDWNQNDPEGEGYIKNRPFYEKIEDKVLFDGVFTTNEDKAFDQGLGLQEATEYIVVVDGISYTKKAYWDDTDGITIYLPLDELKTYISICNRYIWCYTNDAISKETHTIKVVQPSVSTIVPLDEKYIPSDIVRSSMVQEFDEDAKEQARKNIGAIAHTDLPENIWIASTVLTATGGVPEYRVQLENSYNFKPYNVGTIVLVPRMPIFAFRSVSGFRLSVNNKMVSYVEDFEGNLIRDDTNAPYAESLGLFYYTGSRWRCIPIAGIANDTYSGYVRLLDNASPNYNSDEGYAATPKAIHDACDRVRAETVQHGTKAFTMTSSTEGSTKQFRITVDDSSTITATEIV